MTDLVQRADRFAELAHAGQQRKYTGEQYVVHPREVAAMVRDYGGTDAMIAAALLHDTVEDTETTHEDLLRQFGSEVAFLVRGLTHVSRPGDGNRAYRKMVDREFLSLQGPQVQTIKYADMINNSVSILEYDPNFAPTYMREMRDLLMVMDRGDPDLYALAMNVVADYFFGD